METWGLLECPLRTDRHTHTQVSVHTHTHHMPFTVHWQHADPQEGAGLPL